jgi:hypothetical protein
MCVAREYAPELSETHLHDFFVPSALVADSVESTVEPSDSNDTRFNRAFICILVCENTTPTTVPDIHVKSRFTLLQDAD